MTYGSARLASRAHALVVLLCESLWILMAVQVIKGPALLGFLLTLPLALAWPAIWPVTLRRLDAKSSNWALGILVVAAGTVPLLVLLFAIAALIEW
jgi:hypothetical protein